MNSLVNGCWWCFKWALALSLAAALAVGFYLYQQVDEEIRRHVETLFAKHYSDLSVEVKSARRIDGEGIEVTGISIAEPDADGPRAELAYFDQILITCSTELTELVSHPPQVSRIVVRRPKIFLTRRADGSWSSTRLFPLPKFGECTPTIAVENATLEVFDPSRIPSATFTLHDVNLTITPPENQASPPGAAPAAMSPAASTSAGGVPNAAASCPTGPLRFAGYGTGDHLRRVEFQGVIEDGGERWSLDGKIEGLEFNSELHAAMPAPAAEKLAELRAVRATANLAFHVASPQAAGEMPRFEVEGRVVQGRIDDSRSPLALTDLRTRFRATNDELLVTDFTARNGPTIVRLTARRAGLAANSPVSIDAHCTNLLLQRSLVANASEQARAHWNRFLPAGVVDVDLKLDFDGQTWRPNVTAKCHDVAFTFYKFPYRLERAAGTVTFADGRLGLNLTAHGGGDEVYIYGGFQNLGPDYSGQLDISGSNLRLDQQLIAALPGDSRHMVASLHPAGTFHLKSTFWRQPGANEPLHRHVAVTLQDCTARYDKFSYPLSNVRGTIVGRDDEWTFNDLSGVNGSGHITCSGRLGPTPAGPELVVTLRGSGVPLDDELRDALRLPLQQLWNDLKPHGAVHLVDSTIRFNTQSRQLSIAAEIEPVAEVCSIEPRFFPYLLDRLAGRILYQDGQVQLIGMRAAHDQVTLRTAGACSISPDGRWQVELKNLSADRLAADSDLVHALPGPLRSAIYKLDPRGIFYLQGGLRIAGSERRDEPVAASWDVRVDLHNSKLHCGVPLENVHGNVRLVGDFDGQQFRSRGDLNLESLTWQKLQFTQLRGPLWLDAERILFGRWAGQAAAQDIVARGDRALPMSDAPRQVTAEAYGGSIRGDGWVTLGRTSEFGLQANLTQADLSRFSEEVFAGGQRISGRMQGSINLRGGATGAHTLQGEGNLSLTDADIYELPQMVALLKILSVREPDRTAFTRSEANFRIQGEHVYFNQIDFYGDAISLKGTGEVGLDRKLALNFYAVVGRDEFDVPLVGEILRGASEQMMLVRVDGRLDHPNIRREHFPGVNQVLQELQAGLQGPAQTNAWPAPRSTTTPSVASPPAPGAAARPQ